MFNAIRIAALTTTLVTALATSSAAFANVQGPALYGAPVASSNADRQIVIKPDTKYANVNDGDTVEFQVDGKSFTWHFDTLRGESAFELSKIAPEGIDVGKIIVYVGANPLYRG
jgi:endonuclease YncB( thermonuclease family)